MYIYRPIIWQINHRGYKEQKIHTHTHARARTHTHTHAHTQYKPFIIFVLYPFIKNITCFFLLKILTNYVLCTIHRKKYVRCRPHISTHLDLRLSVRPAYGADQDNDNIKQKQTNHTTVHNTQPLPLLWKHCFRIILLLYTFVWLSCHSLRLHFQTAHFPKRRIHPTHIIHTKPVYCHLRSRNHPQALCHYFLTAEFLQFKIKKSRKYGSGFSGHLCIYLVPSTQIKLLY